MYRLNRRPFRQLVESSCVICLYSVGMVRSGHRRDGSGGSVLGEKSAGVKKLEPKFDRRTGINFTGIKKLESISI